VAVTEDPNYPTDAVLREVAQQSVTDGGRVVAGLYMDGRIYLALVSMDAQHAFSVTHLDWHQASRVAASIIATTELALIQNGWDAKQAVGDVWGEVDANLKEIIQAYSQQAVKP